MKLTQFVGIDISKKTLDFVLLNVKEQNKSKHQQFSNNLKGFHKFEQWLKKQKNELQTTIFCLEHTGIYGYGLAAFLEENDYFYSIVSGLELKRSVGVTRGKNDKIDALKIARYAFLHREEIKQIEKEIDEIINTNEELKQNYKLCTSVTGIGMVNAVLFLIFTNNFKSITEPRKFACYSGVAPFEYSSGTSIKGRTQVSHIANKRIKVQLSNAARSAIVHDGELKKYYKRKMEEGKEFGVVLNAVKFKLITRVFAVIKRGAPYVKLRQAG